MSGPVPLHVVLPVNLFDADQPVSAGFPSPAQDHAQRRIDLNEILILNPLSTFLFRVAGDSMIGVGIKHGDQLIVDRAVEARDGRIVLACVDGEFTVKILRCEGALASLHAANERYAPIVFRDGQEMRVWGVVTWNLRRVLHDGRAGA